MIPVAFLLSLCYTDARSKVDEGRQRKSEFLPQCKDQMSENETSEFAVKDSRASQNDAVEAVEKTATAPEDAEDDLSDLPDPAFLFSIAALRMSPVTLARTLLAVFDAKAWQAMGLTADPMTQEAVKDLPAAQLSIDSVQFFLDKVEQTFTEEERRDARRRLNDLRVNYLNKVREP